MPTGLDGNPEPVVSPQRTQLLERIARAVDDQPETRVTVAVDGASGTGKSTLADELARVLVSSDRSVVRASIDSFHRPRRERYRLGKDSPEGYYRDSHDLKALRHFLLEPFAEGAELVCTGVFDEPSDRPAVTEERVPPHTVLVFDGLFLHRPELAQLWNVSVLLVAEQRRTRMLDTHRVEGSRRARYVEGQAIYEREAGPTDAADFVIDNDDFVDPVIL